MNFSQPLASPKVDSGHWIVIPLFGCIAKIDMLLNRLRKFLESGFGIVLIDNNPDNSSISYQLHLDAFADRYRRIENGNRGGIAGGFNRGIAIAADAGATTITLLDQDSSIDPCSLYWLREPFNLHPGVRLLVGPRIWDERRGHWHQPTTQYWNGYLRTRLLISSGCTFMTEQWSLLGPLHEDLFIDFVDHAWCFRAQVAGFVLLQHPQARLEQQFGQHHPHPFCRLLGLELYSPQRHYYSLRNLRWLVKQWWIPLDLRFKELVKMSVKPLLWLLFEPQRRANARAILSALRAPLPESVDEDRLLEPRQVATQ